MTTDILSLPELQENQASKYLTHNQALRTLEGMLIRVLSRTNGGPPVSPTAGDTYIVDVATGVWSTAAVNQIAHYYSGAWHFYAPVEGQSVWCINESARICYVSAAWNAEIGLSDISSDRYLSNDTNTFIGVGVVGAGNLAHTAGNEGWGNTAVGGNALYSNTTGDDNTAIGHEALNANTIGVDNTAVGQHALVLNTEGSWLTALGEGSLENNTTGNDNTAVGQWCLRMNQTGNANTAVGRECLEASTGSSNTAIGFRALEAATGSANCAMGRDAGKNITTGYNNLILGYNTGLGITTGHSNTIIGSNVTGLSPSLSNTIILADGQGNQRLYVNSSGYVGIGTTDPLAALEITTISGNDAKALWLYKGYGNAFKIYESSDNKFTQRVGSIDIITLDNTGNVGIGTSAPGSSLEVYNTISSTGHDHIRLSNAFIDHGMTDLVPTNVFGTLARWGSNEGGTRLSGFSESGEALLFEGTAGIAPISYPAVEIRGYLKNGTGRTTLGSSDPLFGVSNGAGRLVTILGDGSFGIGITNPSRLFYVSGSPASAALARFEANGDAGAYVELTESGHKSWALGIDNGDTKFKIRENNYAGNVAVTIDSTGNFGIGTDTPGATLDVAGNMIVSGLKSGTSQANAGAAANELWIDTADNSIKIGV